MYSAYLVSNLLLASFAAYQVLHYAAVAAATVAGGGGGGGQVPSDEAACIAPLESLLECLPYAQGKAASPTAACCANMDKVFLNQKKCLCELMGASFQGGISGLPPFNRTLALHMPSTCNIPADPSKCPGLLGIPPSSPEAKEFTDAALKPNGTTIPPKNTAPSSTTLSAKSNVASASLFTSFPAKIALESLFLLLFYIQPF